MRNVDKELLHDIHNYSANLASREIFLHNTLMSDDNQNPGVEYKMANAFIKNIRILEGRSQEPIKIHMQSIGGEWADGMAIYDAIAMCKSYVTIVVYGQAESMSSIILQAADQRLMTPNAYFMAHYGSTEISTDYLSAMNWADFERKMAETMFDIYAKRCVDGKFFFDKFGKKPSDKQVKQFLVNKLKSGDWYLSAEEAVYYGFADGVINSW
jgi:ATP-dependent protease ClpP protease subunit